MTTGDWGRDHRSSDVGADNGMEGPTGTAGSRSVRNAQAAQLTAGVQGSSTDDFIATLDYIESLVGGIGNTVELASRHVSNVQLLESLGSCDRYLRGFGRALRGYSRSVSTPASLVLSLTQMRRARTGRELCNHMVDAGVHMGMNATLPTAVLDGVLSAVFGTDWPSDVLSPIVDLAEVHIQRIEAFGRGMANVTNRRLADAGVGVVPDEADPFEAYRDRGIGDPERDPRRALRSLFHGVNFQDRVRALEDDVDDRFTGNQWDRIEDNLAAMSEEIHRVLGTNGRTTASGRSITEEQAHRAFRHCSDFFDADPQHHLITTVLSAMEHGSYAGALRSLGLIV